MTQSVWIEIILFLAINLYTQLGKRRINYYRFLIPVVVALYFGHKYIHSLPLSGGSPLVLIICIVIGLFFGVLLVLSTKVLFDNQHFYTKAGVLYALVWIFSLGSRLGFALYATHYPRNVGTFFMSYHINPDIIGPAFILMMLAMLLVRIGGILIRIQLLKSQPKKP